MIFDPAYFYFFIFFCILDIACSLWVVQTFNLNVIVSKMILDYLISKKGQYFKWRPLTY